VDLSGGSAFGVVLAASTADHLADEIGGRDGYASCTNSTIAVITEASRKIRRCRGLLSPRELAFGHARRAAAVDEGHLAIVRS